MVKQNEFEQVIGSIFAIVVFFMIGFIILPTLTSSMVTPLIFIVILIFYASIILVALALFLKFLEMLGVKF